MTPSIHLDANFVIGTFEVAGPDSAHGWSVLDAINSDALVATTSELTITELLPKPIANADRRLERAYLELLDGPLFRVTPVSRSILIHAARLPASGKALRLPDAIHLSTALVENCTCFLTNDLRLNLPANLARVRLTPTVLADIERLHE